MRAKHKEREEAISLRKSGLTYSEIRRQLNVSPSSLSNWLKHIALTTSQQERIAQLQEIKRVEGITKHKEKVARSSTQIKTQAAAAITPLSAKELLLVGTALYWAEGSKQTKKSISQGLIFNNSDAKMIQLYYHWLTKTLQIKPEEILIEIYIHINQIHRKSQIIEYWSSKLSLPATKFDRIYVKHHTTQKNDSRREYYGLARVVVRRSTNLNRQVSGWIQGICNQCGIV